MPALGNCEETAVKAKMLNGVEGMPEIYSGAGELGDASRTPTPVSSRPHSPSSPVLKVSGRPSSPIPKVIGRGRVGAKQTNSPTNSAGPSTALPDGNPPTGIVKGRRASLEGAQGGAAVQSRPQAPAPRGSGGSTIVLGEGWEEDVDPRTGRTFYVNHKIKKWSWNPPVSPAATNAATKPKDSQSSTRQHQDPIVDGGPNELPRVRSASTIQSSSPMSRNDSGQSVGESMMSDATKLESETAAPVLSHNTSEAEEKGNKIEDNKAEVLDMNDKGMQGKQFDHKAPAVPPLNMPAVHTPVKRDGSKETSANAKMSRFEHDREVDELKSEINLIRSQSKDHRRRTYLDPWSSRLLDSRTDGDSTPVTNTSKVKGSALTNIDISKIRQVRKTRKSYDCLRVHWWMILKMLLSGISPMMIRCSDL